MIPALSFVLLGILLPAVLVVAVAAAPYSLIVVDLFSVLLPGQWTVRDVWVDVTDVVLLAVAVAVALQPAWRRRWRDREIPNFGLWLASAGLLLVCLAYARRSAAADFDPIAVAVACYGMLLVVALLLRRGRNERRAGIPHVELWILYGTLASVAYLHAPANHPNFSSPFAVAYQIYRYSWKPILYFALALLVVGERRKVENVFLFVVLAADLCAVEAVQQGYAGIEVSGPFLTKNQLGGNLVIPFVLAFSGLLYPPTPRRRVFYLASLLLLARALTMSTSRGAFLAGVAGVGIIWGGLLFTPRGRSRALRFAAGAAVAGAVVFAVRPNFFEGPAVQELLALGHGTGARNFQWRLEERWPYFWDLLLQHPWFGIGTEVDPTLGISGNTPHNGYLALAVTNGVPALAIFLGLTLLAVHAGLRAFRFGPEPWHRIVGLTLAAAIIGLLVHNLIDATFLLDFAGNLHWMLIALALALGRRPQAFPARSVAGTADREPARAGLAFSGAGA